LGVLVEGQRSAKEVEPEAAGKKKKASDQGGGLATSLKDHEGVKKKRS